MGRQDVRQKKNGETRHEMEKKWGDEMREKQVRSNKDASKKSKREVPDGTDNGPV